MWNYAGDSLARRASMRHFQRREFEAPLAEVLAPERIDEALVLKPPRAKQCDLDALVASGIALVRQMGEATRAAEARANATEARARELIELAADELISARSRLLAANAQVRAAEE